MQYSFNKKNNFNLFNLALIGLLLLAKSTIAQVVDQRFVVHIVDPSEDNLRFYWQDEHGDNFRNFSILKDWLQSKGDTLVFAMNGGMYNPDLAPQGLYVENGQAFSEIDTAKNGYGNFYMKPNGIFYLRSNHSAGICRTEHYKPDRKIRYATQSGPMLLIEGELHHRFIKGSENLNIRNGVGILPNGHILFAMSKERINFYDFATYFKNKGCRNALYLDGFVSRTYLPAQKWIQLDGNFGVIIAEFK